MRHRQLVVLDIFVDDSAFDAGWPQVWPWEQMVRHHVEINGHDADSVEVRATSTDESVLDQGGAADDYEYKRGDWRYRHTEPEIAPHYVNVYEVGQGYGGPEEGGWWFSTGVPVRCDAYDTIEEARIARESLLEDFPETGRRYSVNGGEDYRVVIEDHPGEAWPDYRPHYE